MVCGCDRPRVAFAVPPDLRPFFGDAPAASICPTCLDLEPTDPDGVPEDPDFEAIVGGFPSGEGGVAMALAVGLLVDSLALHREAIGALLERVIDAGADPWLVVERLTVTPTVTPDADLDRVRRQLDQLLG